MHLLIVMNIMSWNVTGLMSSSSYLCDTLTKNNIDFCGISEHFLYPHNMHFIDTLSSEYRSHCICDRDLMTPGNRRVGKGGVAIMWHKRWDSCVTPLPLDDDRIVGVHPLANMCSFFQLYLPCSNHSIDIFRTM